MLRVGLGFGFGASMGNLIAVSAWGGLDTLTTDANISLCFSLQNATTALLGGALLFSLLLQTQRKINWWLIIIVGAGFGVAVFIQDWLIISFPQVPSLRWWSRIAYAVWGISLVLTSRDRKKYLLYGLLVVLGALSGRYLWIGIGETLGTGYVETIYQGLLGGLLGIFLAMGQRWQKATLLPLFALLLCFLQGILPHPEQLDIWFCLVDGLHFVLVGAGFSLACQFFGMTPGRKIPLGND